MRYMTKALLRDCHKAWRRAERLDGGA
jgi:hypothetical protein